MNEKNRNLQAAMLSFAHWGGMLVNTKQMNAAAYRRSHPLSLFMPPLIRRQRV